MGRWEPDAQGRLHQAAMGLFVDQGFDRTSVAQIAERAGVTERTFFRYFADKREVLFAGSDLFESTILAAVAAAPAGRSPLDVVVEAYAGLGPAFFDERRPFASQRAAVIAANPELQERELVKLERVRLGVAEALVARGVDPVPAQVAAATGAALFHAAFAAWVAPDERRPLADIVRQYADEVRQLTA